jgi:hypothetical protein
MSQQNIVVIIALAILNGLFSPALIAVFALQGIWYPTLLPPMLPLVLLASSLIVSTLTLMIGGVPAALYERVRGNREPSAVSGAIWFASVLVLTLPALPNLLKAMGLA